MLIPECALHIFRYDDLGPAKLLLMQTLSAADHNGVALHALQRVRGLQSSLCGIGQVFSGNCPESGGIADYALLWFEGLELYTCASGRCFSPQSAAKS